MRFLQLIKDSVLQFAILTVIDQNVTGVSGRSSIALRKIFDKNKSVNISKDEQKLAVANLISIWKENSFSDVMQCWSQ